MPPTDLQSQIEPLLRLALAAVLGALVGFEREAHGRPAGLRTYTLVSMGACLFTLVSIYGFPGSDASRVAAQIVTGIGFIGAGTIIQAQSGVRGVTTAAGIWAIAAVGMAAGTGLWLLAVVTAVASYGILQLRYRSERPPDETGDTR
jgi:putative Mg2+ transporter-C (MgtC) family protein